MNGESNSKFQGTRSGKQTSYKRTHRANRPVLISEQKQTDLAEPATQGTAEALQPETSVAVEEVPQLVERKRRPGFFANVGKSESVLDTPAANPTTARMARATRGKVIDTPKKQEATRKNGGGSGSAREKVVSQRPRSGFKMRHIWGMMSYLLVADFLGIWIQNYMVAQHLDAVVFTVGSFRASRSTLIFLALLITILIVMARFDLIPTGFKSMAGGASPRKDEPVSKRSTLTSEAQAPRPTMKQGTKGEHDDLYQEYRANQRYFQRRDRKR